jgi:hypothetical protein
LRAEDRERSGSGAIHARRAFFEHETQQIVVFAHGGSAKRAGATDSIPHFLSVPANSFLLMLRSMSMR